MAKIDFVHLSNLEDEGYEQALGEAVVEILRRGDVSAEAQRWLADHFKPDRSRRKRGPGEKPQTKFRLEFKPRNGMRKSNDGSPEFYARYAVFEKAYDTADGDESVIQMISDTGEYGGFAWSEPTARKYYNAVKANRETE